MKRALILSGGGARGAFQVGVLKYLDEIGWKPDMICGSSVGAINAVCVGCGMTADEMAKLWFECDRKKMYRFNWRLVLKSLLSRKKSFSALLDNRPMKHLLEKYIDFDRLKKSEIEILITAVRMRTSELNYFSHLDITIDHIMASGAMPMVFPWQYIDGEPYWDGGVMANVPVMPAIDRGFSEILVVLLSPVGHFTQTLPKTYAETGELVFEHFLIGPYKTILSNAAWQPAPGDQPKSAVPKLITVSPSRMLGFRSLLDFCPKQAEKLFHEGYRDAQNQLKELIV